MPARACRRSAHGEPAAVREADEFMVRRAASIVAAAADARLLGAQGLPAADLLQSVVLPAALSAVAPADALLTGGRGVADAVRSGELELGAVDSPVARVCRSVLDTLRVLRALGAGAAAR